MKNILLFIMLWTCIGVLQAQERFSAAGFYSVPNSGREVLDFNPGWRFDRELVNLPHTVQLVPSEASGSRNYQGPAWYSKHFVVDTKIGVNACLFILRRLWEKAAFMSMERR